MLERIWEISHLLGVNPGWIWLMIGLVLLLFIVKSIYPWKPEWKSKKTEDKKGNVVVTHYHIDI